MGRKQRVADELCMFLAASQAVKSVLTGEHVFTVDLFEGKERRINALGLVIQRRCDEVVFATRTDHGSSKKGFLVPNGRRHIPRSKRLRQKSTYVIDMSLILDNETISESREKISRSRGICSSLMQFLAVEELSAKENEHISEKMHFSDSEKRRHVSVQRCFGKMRRHATSTQDFGRKRKLPRSSEEPKVPYSNLLIVIHRSAKTWMVPSAICDKIVPDMYFRRCIFENQRRRRHAGCHIVLGKREDIGDPSVGIATDNRNMI
jgi:hypothetical protein